MPIFEPETGYRISRFGAALGGRLQGFDQGVRQDEALQFEKAQSLRAQEDEQQQQRQTMMLMDNRVYLDHMRNGRFDKGRELLVNRISSINQLGGDPQHSQGLLDIMNTGDNQQALSESKLFDDEAVTRGFLDPMGGDKPKQQIVDGQLVTIGPEGAVASEIEGLAQGGGSAKTVQSSDILPDGTIVKVFKSGLTEVSDPQGNVITGQQRADKIRESREFGAEIQGKRSRERTLGSEIAKTSIEVGGAAFKKLPVIRGNIANLDKVISAIDQGAKSGAVERFLPSVRAASVELDNLRNQLGLDVIGDVTFGALSKGELDLALDTALPTGLNEPELKAWAENKRSAQTNVLKELRKTAKFFSLGGTITEYLTLQDKISAQGGQEAEPAQRLRFNPETGAIE